MDETLSRRERKKIETRQHLLEAALRLFCERGYDASTVEQITQDAGVAKGTFFNYFDSKEAILPALAEWRLQQIADSLRPGPDTPESPVERIKVALCLASDDPLTNPPLARRLFAAMMQHPNEVTRPVRALTRLVADQVRQAQDAGEIRADLDPVHVGGVIRAAFFQQIMVWHCGYRPVPLRELLCSTVDLLMDGIAGPDWTGTA